MNQESSSTALQLIRLTPRDVGARSDTFRQFSDLIIENEAAYPAIRQWLHNKVGSGIRSSERTAFLGLMDDVPVASAVVKRGKASKFCHLRLHHGIQQQNLGELFFCLMAAEIRRDACEIHFTLPESLWHQKKDFFRSFGFESATKASTQYRLFDEELKCSASFETVWRSVLRKLPKLSHLFSIGGHSMESPLIMSMSPVFAERIFSGHKTVEVRRRFSTKWIGSRAVVYASSPSRNLLGEALIANIVADDPNRIWNTFENALGCSREEFEQYVGDSPEVYAIVLDRIVPYLHPIPITQLEFMLQKEIHPPQSYCTTSGNQVWSQAVSLAAILHGSLRLRSDLGMGTAAS